MAEESEIQKEIASRKDLKPGYLHLLDKLFPTPDYFKKPTNYGNFYQDTLRAYRGK